MFQDADLEWAGGFPYEVLAFVGITPHTPITEVQDLKRKLMRDGMLDEVELEHSQLSAIHSRLFIDFFLYRVSPEED